MTDIHIGRLTSVVYANLDIYLISNSALIIKDTSANYYRQVYPPNLYKQLDQIQKGFKYLYLTQSYYWFSDKISDDLNVLVYNGNEFIEIVLGNKHIKDILLIGDILE